MSGPYANGRSEPCRGFAEELVSHLYGEIAGARGLAIEDHLKSCAGCRRELESMRETLRVVDAADFGRMVTAWSRIHPPASWEEIRFRLEEGSTFAGRVSRPSIPSWMKVAAALVLAGGSFLAGTRFPAPSGLVRWPGAGFSTSPLQDKTGGSDEAIPSDPDSRLRDFARRTDGYLNRSRFVLLEVSNAEDGSRSESLREITRRLLRESQAARAVADQIDDPHIGEIVVRLEAILREIARLADWENPSSVEQLREKVNGSGMIEQLELLIPEPAGAARRRAKA